MRIQFKILILFFILFSSCRSYYKAPKFLKQCNLEAAENKERHCLRSTAELKQNLSSGIPLFYIGSDSSFHYFHYYFDSTMKIFSRIKIIKTEYAPPKEILLEANEKYKIKIPVHLSDF